MNSRYHLYRRYVCCLVCFEIFAIQGAYAQSTDAVLASNQGGLHQHPLRLKLGLAEPFGSGANLKSTNPDTGLFADSVVAFRFAAGISYDLTPTRSDRALVYSVNADYFVGPDTTDVVVPFLSLIGKTTTTMTDTGAISLSARYLFGQSRRNFPYAEAGMGVYITHVQVNNISSTDQQAATHFSKTQSSPGGKLALGYQTGSGLFGEVEYHLVAAFRQNGLEYNPSSGRVSLGVRF